MKLYNVEGQDEVVIRLGNGLGSVAFFPEVFDAKTTIPTSTKPFYALGAISDAAVATYYDAVTYNFIEGAPAVLGNDVELAYRLNPADVYFGENGLDYTFVSHEATTRAMAEGVSPFTAASNGVIASLDADQRFLATVRMNKPALNEPASKFLVAAAKVYQGTQSVVSDYIVLRQQNVAGVVVKADKKEALYNRTKSEQQIAGQKISESAYVKQFVKLGDAANFEMVYYVQKGEMTVSLDDGKDYVLHAGDSLHFGPGTGRACKNTGVECAEMITVMIKPQA